MSGFAPFSDEQLRAQINLAQHYSVWMEAEQNLFHLPYDLRVKTVDTKAYLYEIKDRSGNGSSLGPFDAKAQAHLEHYRARKAELKARSKTSLGVVEISARQCRAVRLPLLASPAGEILRAADTFGLLDQALLVIGTNAMVAYSLEAGGVIRDAPDETQDFDLAWTGDGADGQPGMVWRMLKSVDPTFTVNLERNFQVRNAKAYEVDVLAAPSRMARLDRRDQPRPLALPEQEWLLLGRPVDQIVACRDARPARIVAPDPRWFALQKLWMSEQEKRTFAKRRKDAIQGRVLLETIRKHMPHYPLDAQFAAQIPEELRPYYQTWQTA